MKRHGDSDDTGASTTSSKTTEVSAASPVTTFDDDDDRHAQSLETRKRIVRMSSAAPALPFGSLAEAFGFVMFLVVFVLATSVVDSESEQAFYFANRLHAALVDAPFALPVTLRSSDPSSAGATNGGASVTTSATTSVQKTFDAIRDPSDVWAFLEGPFADVLYGPDRTASSSAAASSDASTLNTIEMAGRALSYTRVLGSVRLRTLRVQPESCPTLQQLPEYAAAVPFCYAAFSSHTEQTGGYGPVVNSADVTASLAFAFARSFFAASLSDATAPTRTFADLQTCRSDCVRACGVAFGVERYRYTSSCTTQCGVHCKCIYEQPAGFDDLCPNPNPLGPTAPLPTLQFAFNWSSGDVTEAPAARGATGLTYGGSGYVVDLTAANSSLARATFATLHRDRFIDLATRALVVDVTLFHAHAQLFNAVQLVIEFPATGGTFVALADTVVRPFRYSGGATGSSTSARIVLECLVVAYIVWCWQATLQHVWHARSVLQFARSALSHVVTLLFLLAFTVAIALRLVLIEHVYGTLSGGRSAIASASATLSTQQRPPQLGALARLTAIERVVDAIVAALVWLKLLQYAQVSKRMCLLLRMLERAAIDLVWSAIYTLVCLCGFAQIAYLLFGLRMQQFRTLGASIVTLLQAVAGDLEYSAMQDAHHVLGPLFYVAFYALLLLVLLNVFLAILNDAYVQTVAEEEEADARDAEAETEIYETECDTNGERSNSSDGSVHDNADARLRRRAQRERAQLRRYPFSRGLGPALQLVRFDLQRAISDLRAGRSRNAASVKVDPFVVVTADGSVVPRDGGSSSSNATGSVAGASRKWTQSLTKQLDKQLAQHLDVRVREALAAKDAQMAALRSTVDSEIADRLVGLVESSRQKTQRMRDMETTLGSIEKLCQQLLVDTAYLRDDDASDEDERRSSRTSGRFAGGSGGSSATQRRARGAAGSTSMPASSTQRRAPTSGQGHSASRPLSPTGNRSSAKPQSLTAALSRASGSSSSSSSKRLVKRGSGTEEIEEITL